MKIFVAADHAGFTLKEEIVPLLRDELGYEVLDCGAAALDPDDDYPAIIACAARGVSEAVADGDDDMRAIIFGKSGQGEAMVANRFPGVRAAVYYGHEPEILKLSREHNDANVLSLAAGFMSDEQAKDAVRTWLGTDFSGDSRHEYRNGAIDEVMDVSEEDDE